MHAKPAHLIQHHDDVAWRHELFLFDLLCVQDLDAHRLILDALIGPRRGDGDVFLDRRLPLKGDRDHLGLAEHRRCADRHRIETLLHDGDVHWTRYNLKYRPAFRIGLGRDAVDDDLRSRDGSAVRTNDDLDFRIGRSLL